MTQMTVCTKWGGGGGYNESVETPSLTTLLKALALNVS